MKDTPDYIALGWSKPGLLEVAANQDCFGSKMYWWADIALLEVAQPLEGESFDGLLESSDCELHANVLWETDPSEYEDRGRFYQATPFSKVAGGIFGVSANNVSRFSSDFDREVDRCLASGWPTIDEVILGVVVDQHRDNAELSYGPWETLLSNFHEQRMAAWHRLRLLRDCRNRGLNERAHKHYERLNSAWEIDHHHRDRADIHPEAVSQALDTLRARPDWAGCLKIAVWHHPLNSGQPSRITDHGFVDRLAQAGFRLGLHGHIHKGETSQYRYDQPPGGRGLEILAAGTFGAPSRDWVPGYPLQYQLLRLTRAGTGRRLTVETRRREQPNGAWKPDARWLQGPGQDPLPRYWLDL